MSVAPPAGDTRQLAIREARRRLQQKVRNDWEFTCDESCPTLNAYARQSTAVRSTETSSPQIKLPTFDEWRERTYASSDPSSDEEDAKKDSLLRRKRDLLFKPSSQPDDTSSVDRTSESSADADLRRRETRKRRRRDKLEQEMTWNEGLRFWQARRNAWCGAKKASDQAAADDTDEQQDSGHGSIEAHSEEDSIELKHSASAVSLIPVAPALILPGDPTHINITPTLYPSIYSKVVLQSLTPSVPINLRHLISALVEGWQRDGEWPPKGSGLPAVNPSSQAKQGASSHADSHSSRLGLGHFGGVRKGMARMRRSLRLSLSGGGSGSGAGTGTGTTNTGDERAATAAAAS